MKLFELRASGPESGDCTVPYDVIFDRQCTVREFINVVLKKKEWGFISICNYRNGTTIEYDKDAIVRSGNLDIDLLESKIKKATAHGGWTRMDYKIDIWTDEQLLWNKYADILKEIERREDEIITLKKRAEELKDQIEAVKNGAWIENTQLNKDDYVY